jgi:hypothetical protein
MGEQLAIGRSTVSAVVDGSATPPPYSVVWLSVDANHAGTPPGAARIVGLRPSSGVGGRRQGPTLDAWQLPG